MKAGQKRFVFAWALASLAGLLGVGAFNILIDPAGTFPRLHLRTFERLRYLDHDRISKGEMAARGDWEVVIIGSSRAKAGMPATHPFFTTNRACNLSLDGARFSELRRVFDLAVEKNPLKHVWLCLDWYMCSQGPQWILEFPESRFNPDFAAVPFYTHQLLGQASSARSWQAMIRKFRGYQAPPQDSLGFYDPGVKPGRKQRQLFDEVMRVLGPGYRTQVFDTNSMQDFRHIVRVCKEKNIGLHLAVMPVHALDSELLYAGGRWPEVEKWKTALVNVLAEEGVQATFPLWDFSGYAGPPAEPVPAADDAVTRMQFYRENSHFTPLLGAVMVDTMLGAPCTNQFGAKLTTTNLVAHCESMLRDRAEYVRTHPLEIEWVQSIVPPKKGSAVSSGP